VSVIALVLCLESYAAWLHFRLAADEPIPPQLEWLRSALTAVHGRGLYWFVPSRVPGSSRRRGWSAQRWTSPPFLRVLVVSLAAGARGGLMDWAFCELDWLIHEERISWWCTRPPRTGA